MSTDTLSKEIGGWQATVTNIKARPPELPQLGPTGSRPGKRPRYLALEMHRTRASLVVAGLTDCTAGLAPARPTTMA